MFALSRGVPPAPAPEPVAPPPTPPRRKVAPADARAFQPSNFASRKAEADAANAARSRRRLVSLGLSDFHQRKTNGDVEVAVVELFTNLDKPGEMFVRFPGRPELHPMQGDERSESITPLKPIRGSRLSRPAGVFDPSPADPPVRPV